MKTTFTDTLPGIWLGNFRHYLLPRLVHGNEHYVRKTFRRSFGRDPDLVHPKTLNEKMCWLMLHGFAPFQTEMADKYAARAFFEREFGPDGLVPLPFSTTDWRKIRPENLPDFPCIVKSNTGSGWWQIVHDKSTVDWDALRRKCLRWMHTNYYYQSNQPQYRSIKPRILVEKLLLTKEGKIPNDYKLHFANGKLMFTYCSVDREGANYRVNYDPEWKRIEFEWTSPAKLGKTPWGPDIPPPPSFPEMLRIGSSIAARFPYVRVDFFDVDGKLYYGEITLHHGGGAYPFSPDSWDAHWGSLVSLPQRS